MVKVLVVLEIQMEMVSVVQVVKMVKEKDQTVVKFELVVIMVVVLVEDGLETQVVKVQ